ncbi:alpha/beta fold hydrolase [Akkermansiaceae bacterium]|nr:alpha/beta fold hydrolase [Akkermansiaceae bacterium]
MKRFVIIALTLSLGLLAAQKNEGFFKKGAGNRLFYFPTKEGPHTPDEFGYKHEEVTFKSKDGTKLHGWFIQNHGDERKGTVVYSHGNAGAIGHHLSFITWASSAGYQILMYDYRGFGKSEGSVERKGIIEDVNAAIQYAKSRKDVDSKKMFSFGHSLGGAKSITALGGEKGESVAGVISFAGFSSYQKIARRMAGEIALNLVTDELSPRDYVVKISPTPLLIVHGDQDGVVPVEHGRELFEKAKEPKSLIEVKGGSHNGALHLRDRETIKKILKWMNEILKQKS